MRRRMYLEDKGSRAGKVIELITETALVFAVSLFIAQYLFFSVKTESRSMEPTVLPSSTVFTNRIVYQFSSPKRFDCIAFERSETAADNVLIRRVIGLPGESVQISSGTVYIDGEALDVSAYLSEITSDGIAGTEIELGENEYFVMGDTPANSEDSRASSIGNVNRSQIVGKVWLGAQSALQLYFIR